MRRLLVCSIGCALSAGTAAAQDITASAGGTYSSGRYGGPSRVAVGSAYVGLGATYAGWRLDATLPYLMISSGGVPVDAGAIVLPGEGGTKAQGVGDATLRLTRGLPLNTPIDVTLGAEIKLPTGADEVSTGKLDAAADIEFSRDVGSFTPFATVGYRTYGDSDELELDNGWAVSVGSGFTLGKTVLLASYEWSESAVGGPSSQELLGIAAGELGKGWGWTFFGSKGLSEGAADFTVGAGLTRSFGRRAVSPARRLPR